MKLIKPKTEAKKVTKKKSTSYEALTHIVIKGIDTTNQDNKVLATLYKQMKNGQHSIQIHCTDAVELEDVVKALQLMLLQTLSQLYIKSDK